MNRPHPDAQLRHPAAHDREGPAAHPCPEVTPVTGNAVQVLRTVPAWCAARALGYQRLITHTQAGESGASLRAVGFRPTASRAPHRGWNCPSRPRSPQPRPTTRTRWELTRIPPPPSACEAET